MLLPLLVSAIYKEDCYISFLVVIAISLSLGLFLTWLAHPRDKTIYAREGFIIVALSWVIFSAIGALPFVLSGEIPSYVDAFFETVSGFTTTGASIIPNNETFNVELMSKGILFWRSFTHWIGGMGILVFVVAMTNSLSDRSIHVLKAEMPGPTMGKLVPRLKDTAKILYLIYIGLTVLEFIFLFAGGMPLFDSIVHAVGTAGTGGFGIKADSIASYSPYCQWVIAIFMILFGLNFNVYYFTLIRRFRDLRHCGEAWTYLTVVVIATITITLNIMPLFDSFGEALRHGVFQVGTAMSTTGFATENFDLWPQLSKAILFVLMFGGACANSTAGGFKISRVILLIKSIRVQFKRLVHPRSVNTVKFEGKNLDNDTLVATTNYFSLYMICILAVFIAVSFDNTAAAAITEGGFNITETNFTAAVSCFNNIGPGLGMVGPAGGFAAYSPISKLVFCLAMLLGRLEIFPLLLALAPNTWKKHK